MLFNWHINDIDTQSRIQGLQEKMIRLVRIHGKGVYLQSGMEYVGTDSRAKQSRFRMDRFQHSLADFMGYDRSSCRFVPTDLADGFKRFVLKSSVELEIKFELDFELVTPRLPTFKYFIMLPFPLLRAYRQQVMHQSIPTVPIPPHGQSRGICSRCQSRGWGSRNFIAARGLGICILRGDPRAFDTHVLESAMDEFIGKDEAFVEQWLVRQGLEKLVFKVMFSQF